jgi:UDP-N-acetylglucosamine acyltransferase
LSGHVVIDDWAILEGKAAAQQFVHIGKHAFIGGASLIRKDVPPYVKAAREPLAFAGVNSVGLRRRGFTEEQVREIEDIYRVLYVQNSNISKGMKALEGSSSSALLTEITDFIQNSENGVIRGMI